MCDITLRICQGANPPFICFLVCVSGFCKGFRMAAILLKHSSADSRSSLSVLLSAVTNSAITDLNCCGESSRSVLASSKTDVGPVIEVVSNGRVVPGPAALISVDKVELY
jgi:hypothetical protein